MVNFFITPLGPGFALLLGALTLTFVRRTLPRAVPLVIALLAIISAGGLLLRLGSLGFPSQFARPWNPVTLPGGTWLWRVDGWSWLVAVLLLLLGAVALLLAWGEPQAGRAPTLAATLILLAAASFFLFSANLLTLAASWVMLDVALGLRAAAEGGEVGGRAWVLNGLGMLFLLGALLFAGPAGAQQPLSGSVAPLSVLTLLLAALLRCGAYPLHGWLMPQQRKSRSGAITLHLMAPLAGLWLLGQVHYLAGPYWLLQPAWVAVGMLGMFGSGLAAWLAEEQSSRWAWVAINRVSLAGLAAALATEKGPGAVAWPLAMLALGAGELAVGQAIGRVWGWRMPLALAVLTLIGLPGTPGFPARSALVRLASSPGFLPFWGLVLLAETLLVAALLPELIRHSRPSPQPVAPGTAVPLITSAVLLAVPLLIWGLQPPLLASLVGLPAEGLIFQPLQGQLREATWATWVSLLLPWAGGALLTWRRERIFAGLRGWRRAVSRVVSLEWGYGVLGWMVEQTAAVLRGLAAVLEGEGYLGWLGLTALLGWLVWNL